ncbi:MAG TPA: 8-oxo-dGTP diphosphatase MutT [Nitrospiraceae bacterium]|nr:8-oxo-dGTP diphosphatase MutT [Nitrospiraceae bacterium]
MADALIVQVIAGLIRQGRRYLITRRKPGVHLGGMWEFPGGKRETGEAMEDCLRRELREELNIEVTAPLPYRVVRHAYPGKLVELYVFFCSIEQGQPQALGCQDFRWVVPEDLHNFEFPPADKPIIEALTRSRIDT